MKIIELLHFTVSVNCSTLSSSCHFFCHLLESGLARINWIRAVYQFRVEQLICCQKCRANDCRAIAFRAVHPHSFAAGYCTKIKKYNQHNLLSEAVSFVIKYKFNISVKNKIMKISQLNLILYKAHVFQIFREQQKCINNFQLFRRKFPRSCWGIHPEGVEQRCSASLRRSSTSLLISGNLKIRSFRFPIILKFQNLSNALLRNIKHFLLLKEMCIECFHWNLQSNVFSKRVVKIKICIALLEKLNKIHAQKTSIYFYR